MRKEVTNKAKLIIAIINSIHLHLYMYIILNLTLLYFFYRKNFWDIILFLYISSPIPKKMSKYIIKPNT